MSRLAPPVRALLLSVVLGGVAYGVTYLLPMTFESYTSLYFPQAQQSLASSALGLVKPGGEGDSAVVRSLGGALTSPLVGSGGQTATGILLSQTCLREVILKHGLTKKWDLPLEKALRRLRSRTAVSVDKNGFLALQVEAESPKEAVQMIRTFMKHLDRRSEELTVNVSRRNREIIEGRVADSTARVQQLQDEMVVVMKEALVTNLPEVQRLYLETRQRLTEVQIQEASAGTNLASLERSLKEIYTQDRFPGNLSAVEAVNVSLAKLAEEIQTRRLTLEEIGASFKRESPEYSAAFLAVQNAESLASRVLESQKDVVDRGLTPELAAAKAELASLRATADNYARSLAKFDRELAESPAKYAAVERARAEYETAIKGFAQLQGELEMARIAEVRDPSRYEVVDEPFENAEPVSPRRALIAGAVFLLTLAGTTLPHVLSRLREEE